MFQLGKLQFEVEYATFFGGFMDAAMSKRMAGEGVPEFNWHIEIDTAEGDFVTEISGELLEELLEELEEGEELEEEEKYLHEFVSPRLYHNNGFKLDIRSWKDAEGITLNWDSEYNDKGEEAGYLYVFEHEDVTGGTIEFLKRDGNHFFVRWTGTANVYWDEEYGEDVPFVFEGDVEFTGISAHCDSISTLEELRPAMEEFVNLDEYECVSEDSHKFTTGTSYVWRFVPKDY